MPETLDLQRHLSKWIQLSDNEFSAFQSKLKEKHLKKDEIYLAEGDVCKKIALVTSGGLRMFYNIKGEERCKDFQFEGQFSGSIYSLLTGKPSKFSIAALENTTLLELRKQELFNLYDNYKSWERFGRLYAQQMFIYKEQRETSLLFDSSVTRYENLLREQPQLAHRVPLKYLASYLGIKPESLSRIRKKITGRK
jgi:CRP-like cAMP-binding protein